MYRIVASDMDETFLARDHSVPQANINAVRRLRELGCLFVPASGRAYGSILHTLAPLPSELLQGSYVISYNGACINRYGEAEPIASHAMGFDAIEQLFAYGLTQPVGMHVYQLDGKVWGVNITDDERAYYTGRMEVEELAEPDISFLRDVPLAKILFCRADLAFLHRLADEMPPELLEGVDVTFSSGRYLEFMPHGVSKGSGLRQLAGLLGIPMEQTIACGDALNDLPMLEAAGIGVAAANATDGLPERADYTTQADCDQGVIAEVVERFVEPAPQK